MSNFVFPANDAGYRKRKRAHKACEQCKRRRKRCDVPMGSQRCEPCEKSNIMCSLAPEFELQEKVPRLDNLAREQSVSGVSSTEMLTTNEKQQLQPPPQQQPQQQQQLQPQQQQQHQYQQHQHQQEKKRPGMNRASSASSVTKAARQQPAPSPARPSMSRTASFNPQTKQQHSPPKHKRTNSHSPTNINQSPSGNSPSPSSLFNKPAPSPFPATLPDANAQKSEHIGVWVKGQGSSRDKINPMLYTYLASMQSFSMPLRGNRDGLIDIYCNSIDPIFPILDKQEFLKLHRLGQAPTLLLHAVLLAAARHSKASVFLGGAGHVRQFCTTTAMKIRALLFAEVEQDRLTLVRVYALLSLHSEGPDGLENSCSDLQKAVHYAQSLGLHHERPFVDKEQLQKLWWSVWCMDRLNACVNARPLIINLADVGVKQVEPSQCPRLAEMIKICYRLERVIYMYRPGSTRTQIPGDVDQLFEGDDTVDPHRALLALMHHSAIVLAHKREGSTDSEASVLSSGRGAAGGATMDTSLANQNTTTGVMCTPVTMVMAEEETKKGSRRMSREKNAQDDRLLSAAGSILRILRTCSDLPPLPLVPYTASLTLTVFLRTFPKHDAETGFYYKDSCEVLEQLASRWWVAGAMGSMGRNVFESLKKSEQQEREQQQEQEQEQQQAYQQQAAQHQGHEPQGQMPPGDPLGYDNDFNMGTLDEYGAGFMDDIVTPVTGAMNGFATAPQPNGHNHSNHQQQQQQPQGPGPGTGATAMPMEEQYLDMFSDLPNQTSFLDHVVNFNIDQAFSGEAGQWFEERKLEKTHF